MVFLTLINNMTLVPLQQADPIRYKAWMESSQQPGATLSQTQAGAAAAGASAAHTMATLPAAQAQTNAATQNIPIQTDTPPVTQPDIQSIKNTYQKAWQSATTATQRDTIAGSFKQATGTDLYNLYLPAAELPDVSQTLATKHMIDNIKSGMQGDPNLKKVIGNPINGEIYNLLGNVPGGQALAQKFLGLSDNGMQALSNFTKLQASGDRQLVGGRVSGYMVDLFGKAQPGIGRSVSDNVNQLNNFSDQIDKNLNLYAKNHGFSQWQDVPGLSAYDNQLSGNSTYKPPLSSILGQ